MSLTEILNKESIEPNTLLLEQPTSDMESTTSLRTYSLSSFDSKSLGEYPLTPVSPYSRNSITKTRKKDMPNARFLHVLSERRKRRQMNYLFRLVKKALKLDPARKFSMMETLILAIDRLSDGEIRVDLEDLDLDVEKEGDEKFLSAYKV